MNPKGTPKPYQISPTKPVKKPSIIVKGINGKTRMFAGSATKDKFPILYKIKGKTKIYAAHVTEIMSRNLNLSVTHIKYFSILGARNITATVAIKES